MKTSRSAPTDDPRRAARSARWSAALPALLALAVLLAYGNSFRGSFVYDDQRAIRDNPHVRALWPPSLVLTAPPDASVNRRPVVALSLALNYAADRLDVFGYHAVNVAIHVAATLLAFALLRRALARPPRKDGARAPWLAAAVTLLWSIHPLLTDAVDYVVQRTELLMSLCLLLTIYCVARASESGRQRRWLALAVVACALGMASKEVMVVAPLVALLYDRTFLSGSFHGALRARGRAYAALAATWLVLAALVVLVPSEQRASGLVALLSPLAYLRTQAGVVVHYLRLAVWPSPLVILYDDWTIARDLAAAALPGAFVLALLGLSLWLLRARPRLGFIGAWFFLILAPTSSLLPIPTEIAAERRMYLPLLAVVATAVLGFDAAFGAAFCAARQRAGGASRAWTALGAAAVLAAALALGLATRRRNEDYRDERGMWLDALAKRPGSAAARINLGYLLEREGRLPEALDRYRQALALRPESGLANANVGGALLAVGRPQDAVAPLREAVRLSPRLPQARVNLGAALIGLRRIDEGARELEEAVRLDPTSADAHNDLGFAYTLEGRTDLALTELAQAIRWKPESAPAHFNMGIAQSAAHRTDAAVAEFSEAVRLDPKHAQAHMALALILAERGASADAVSHAEEAVRLSPGRAWARQRYGLVLSRLGRASESIAQYREAVRLEPQAIDAVNNLAWALATCADSTLRDGAEAVRLAEGAADRTGRNLPDPLDTLAAAYAAAGRYDDAIRAASLAADRARATGADSLAQAIASRRALYASRRPYVEPAIAAH